MDQSSGNLHKRANSRDVDVVGVFQLALLAALFVAFFAALLASVFELFRFADLILMQEWTWGGALIARASLMLIVAVVVIRVALWLARSILGLVTRKYDGLATLLDESVPLDASDCSALYDQVHQICRQLDAPRPDQIRLSPLPECFVVEDRRFSLATQRSLILVLGLPQMLVFTMGELRVVLVHEMVHLGRRDTTLTVFLFRFVDSIQRALDALSARWWHRVDPLYWFFAAFHWALGLVVGPIQRRTEARADRASAELCGGELAAHTLLKDWFVDGQFDETLRSWSDRAADQDTGDSSLRANLYRLFADRWRELSADAEQYLADRLQDQPDSAFDPHPAMRNRLAMMRQFPAVDGQETKRAVELLPDVNRLELEAARLLSELSAP